MGIVKRSKCMNDLMIHLGKTGYKETGYLSFFENDRDIPFSVKRIYYTYDVPLDTKRGMHAHRELDQFIWCPYGEIEVILDNGYEKKTFMLDTPEKGLLVLKGYWHDMYWRKEGSVLCAAASDYYTEADYIRDYSEFLDHEKKGYWKNEN